MSQPLFGTGLLTLTPTISGVVTPIGVAVLKDISLDESYSTKKLVGDKQFAVDMAKGEGSITGKAKSGYFHGGLINAILSGSTVSVGSNVAIFNETATIPGTPFNITVTKSANWVSDLSVFDITSQKYLTRVASGPTTGQYSVTAGVYTFAAADTTHIVAISYDYAAAAIGTTVKLTNQPMGTNTAFSLKLYNNYQPLAGGPNSFGIYLPLVVVSKLNLAFKNNDFFEKGLDFEAIPDGAGNIVTHWTGN